VFLRGPAANSLVVTSWLGGCQSARNLLSIVSLQMDQR
jgi:hypothetical protein